MMRVPVSTLSFAQLMINDATGIAAVTSEPNTADTRARYFSSTFAIIFTLTKPLSIADAPAIRMLHSTANVHFTTTSSPRPPPIVKSITVMPIMHPKINTTFLMLSFLSIIGTRIDPIIEPIDEYIKDWLESHPGGMNPYDDPPDLETERGEFVRTKSEKILADTFYKLGIPYQYEPEFVLKNGYCKYPDFILLNVIHRKTYYWEHMGLTDEYDYATKNFKKLLVYERNGLVLGDNLILSLETDDMALDMKMVHKKIQDYLL